MQVRFLLLVALAALLGLLYRQGADLLQRRHATSDSDSQQLIGTLRARLAEADARAARAEAKAEAAQRALSTARAQSKGGVAVAAAASAPSDDADPFIHTISTLPAKPGDLMMMTYATGGVREMLHNWVLHVKRLGLPILVSAMDRDVILQCTAQSFHCLDWSHTATTMDTSYVRGSFGGFRALGVRKLDALLPVLRAGIDVVLSDVDCVWSSSPLPMFRGELPGFEDFAHADVIVATDCMSPELDTPAHQQAESGCYRQTVDKNTGVLAVRATPDGIATMAEWQVRLAVGQKDEQDQTTFNDLLDGNGRGHRWGMSPAQRMQWARFATEWCGGKPKMMRGFNALWEGGGAAGGAAAATTTARSTPGSRRIFEVCFPNVTRSARIGVFPISDVAGGHTFFVQQLHLSTGRWPMAVHATYQFGDQPDYPFGKRQRFRDWGMWLVDDDEESVVGSRYLVLEDDTPPPKRQAWQGYTDLHVRGRQHVDHLERTRQRLALGFALARTLNRTVVLPTLWCYCDKFWHRLDKCAIPSATSSQPLPFVCPLDHVIDPTFLHGTGSARARRLRRGMLAPRADGPWEDGLPFRGRYWLRRLGAHPRVGMASATLGALPPGDDTRAPKPPFEAMADLLFATRSVPTERAEAAEAARKALVHTFVPAEEGPRLMLPAGRTDAQLRSALRLYDHVPLLRVSLTDAGSLLRCFEQSQAAADMRELTRWLFQHEWCYRPFQMTTEWAAVERRGKPRHRTEPWCVWGFATPQVPPVC